jgi:hypothetical protein
MAITQFPNTNSTSSASSGAATSIDLVASGAITAGDPVAQNVDGTVSKISSTVYNYTAGSVQNFAAVGTYPYRMTSKYMYNSDTFAIVYRTSTSMYVVLGTLSGTTMTYGTPVLIASGATDGYRSCYDALNDRFIVMYNISSTVYVVAITASGTVATVGTPVTVTSTGVQDRYSLTYHLEEDRLVIGYYTTTGSTNYLVAGSISGTTITLGTPITEIPNASYKTYTPIVGYDEDNKLIAVILANGTTNGNQYSWVYSLSNTTFTSEMNNASPPIALKTTAIVNYSSGYTTHIEYDPVNKQFLVVLATSGTNGVLGYFSIDANKNITPGIGGFGGITLQVAIPNGSVDRKDGAYLNSYQNTSSNYMIRNYPLVYGGSGTPPLIRYYDYTDFFIALSTSSRFVEILPTATPGKYLHLSLSATGSYYGESRVYQLDHIDTNASGYFGIANTTVSNGETVSITLPGGVNENQTGLIAGTEYFVQSDGTLGVSRGFKYSRYYQNYNVNNSPFHDVYKKVGIAISPTSILLTKDDEYVKIKDNPFEVVRGIDI